MSNKAEPIIVPNVRNITVSGRIGTGKTTIANHLGLYLSWDVLDGGKLFRNYVKEKGIELSDKEKIPDEFDLDFEKRTKNILTNEKNQIVQSHLAGFIAQGLDGVCKILVVCEEKIGKDAEFERMDRIMNRDLNSVEDARREIKEREENNLKKFRRLYVDGDESWVYWDKKYYDLIVNTHQRGQREALLQILDYLGLSDEKRLNMVFEK